ncbi:MAG: dihydrolipoamide acetyltransferase family protein [Hyphomicrobiaceae bacterium]
MLIEFRLPQFGMGMSDGTIIAWHKQEGEVLVEGEPLLEIEAAKTSVEVGAPASGVLKQIIVPVDQNVPVQTIIALIESGTSSIADAEAVLAEEADVPAIAAGSMQASKAKATPLARRAAESAGVDLDGVTGTGAGGRIRRDDVHAAAKAGAGPAQGRVSVQVEPRARRAAKELGIDLELVTGSGPNGRIVEADVRSWKAAAVEQIPAASAPALQVAAAAEAIGSSYVEVPHSKMRTIIAERLAESKQTVPHFYLAAHCQIDALLAARARINAAFPDEKVSVNDFVIKAVATALMKVPEANVTWTEAAMRCHSVADIAVAVATEGGLITPIVRSAHVKTLRAISAEAKDLAARARSGGLSPREYKGGSASVSNLGMFGVEEFSAIINPPQSCIFAVGAGIEKPVARNGALAVATVMTCTMSVDHRAVDGAVAAQLLAAFKSFIEEPLALMA